MSAKLSAALSPAAVDGLNVIVTVQLPPEATGAAVEQVEAAVLVKSAAFAPVMLGLDVKVSDAFPVFISVTVITALVIPSDCGPNGRVPGRLTAGAVPVPVSETV